MANNLAKLTAPVQAFEEARYPFLDQTLLEFLLSIPADQLLRPGERRSLMRRSLVGIVPKEILSRQTKQVGARTPVIILEKYSDELQGIYQMSLSSRLGYIHEAQLLRTICDARAGKIYQTIGTYLGYAVAHFTDFYDLENILILGRVTSGPGGEVILAGAREVLEVEFPELADRIAFHIPDEKDKRHGQAVAAASLPIIDSGRPKL